MSVGQRIKIARESKGLTQEELGVLCNTTKQTIFKYESDIITNIPFDRVERIAAILEIPPARLLGWEEPSDFIEDLNDQEQQLLALSRQLNEEGREKLIDYADDLVTSGKYIKSNPNPMDKEA